MDSSSISASPFASTTPPIIQVISQHSSTDGIIGGTIGGIAAISLTFFGLVVLHRMIKSSSGNQHPRRNWKNSVDPFMSHLFNNNRFKPRNESDITSRAQASSVNASDTTSRNVEVREHQDGGPVVLDIPPSYSSVPQEN